MQTLHPSHWHLLNPEPSTFLNCRHIVILFWCAEALGQHIASVSGEQRSEEGGSHSPNPACSVWWLPRCLVLQHFLNNARLGFDIFIPEPKWQVSSPRCVYWLSEEVSRSCHPAYINIFSAPFTLSIEVVTKSALCHVHLKYLMFFFLRGWNLSPHEWISGVLLGPLHERKY